MSMPSRILVIKTTSRRGLPETYLAQYLQSANATEELHITGSIFVLFSPCLYRGNKARQACPAAKVLLMVAQPPPALKHYHALDVNGLEQMETE
jgi:hypothetical protein